MQLSTLASALCLLASSVTASGDRCVPGQAIIKLDPSLRGTVNPVLHDGTVVMGVPGVDELCRRRHVTAFKRLVPAPHPRPVVLASGADMLYLVSVDASSDVDEVRREFEQCPQVEYACPNALLPLHGVAEDVPNDPRFGEQWALPRIRAPQAWDTAHGDSSVVIAVMDDGLLWSHEDIRSNLWVNTPEDLNGNRRFDTLPPPNGDMDGIDQDGNGYVDDVIGWDFVDGRPNPMPEGSDDHGTPCWGVANAVTDNGMGIAAPPWNVRGMALRCGGGGSVNLAAAIAAIYYGIDKNVWVHSMSFGSTSPYQPMNDACQAIWGAGALSVASAGSDGMSYPAAYPNVIAVTSSDQNDYKASWAAYGTWIDVCAPGVQILTTSRYGYLFFDGTSISAPMVAGVLAWFRSAYPDITNDSALALLYERCDSMPDPLYPQGLLGHGRIAMMDSGPSGAAEASAPQASRSDPVATIVHGVLWQSGAGHDRNPAEDFGSCPKPDLVDATGRAIMSLYPGPNDVRALAPGIYFVRRAYGVGREASSVTKVVLTR